MVHDKMSSMDKKFQAESDARMLAEAQVISGDKGRMKAAQGAAKSMAAEATKQAQAMTKVAKNEAGRKALNLPRKGK